MLLTLVHRQVEITPLMFIACPSLRIKAQDRHQGYKNTLTYSRGDSCATNFQTLVDQ